MLQSDPHEQRDLSKSHVVAKRACELYLSEGTANPAKRHRLTSMAPFAPPSLLRGVLDAATRKKLEALGYINR